MEDQAKPIAFLLPAEILRLMAIYDENLPESGAPENSLSWAMDTLIKQEHSLQNVAADVFDKVLAYSKSTSQCITILDPANKKVTHSTPCARELDEAICNYLNHRTIGYFLELVQANRESAKQAARAIKRHSENHAMKAQVFDWLGANRRNFSSMDKTAEALTKVVPMGFRTLRGWVSEWHKLQPPGTQ